MLDFLNDRRNFVQQPGNQQALAFLAAGGAVAVSPITAIIGPMVALYVMGRQIRATVVSTNRQKWINSLRDTIENSWLSLSTVTESGGIPKRALS